MRRRAQRAGGRVRRPSGRASELGRRGRGVEQRADVRLRAAQRLEGGDPLQRVATRDVEDDRVPGGGGDLVGVAAHALAAEAGAGVLGRRGDGRLDLGVGGEAHQGAARPAAVARAPCPGARRCTAGRRGAAAGGPSRGRRGRGSPRAPPAWPPSRARTASDIGSTSSRSSTDSQRSSTSAVCASTSEPAGPRRTCAPARGTRAAAAPRSAVRPSTSVTRCASVGSCETRCISLTGAAITSVEVERAVLDHREHERGGAELEVGRDLGEVGVADDHVQPAVLLRIGVRLVAGVDDRALERGLEADLDLEEVGALRELEAGLRPVLPEARRGRRRVTTWRETKNGVRWRTIVGERRRAAPSGSSRGCRTTRPCRRCCSCRGSPAARRAAAARARRRAAMTRSPALSHDHASRGLVHLGAGVLRVRVVDVEPRAVGEDDVGQAEVLVGELAGIGLGRGSGRTRARRAAGLLARSPSGPARRAPTTEPRRR